MWDRARRTGVGFFGDFLIFTFVCMATCDVTAERRNATPRKQRLQCKTLFCTCWLPQKVNLTQKNVTRNFVFKVKIYLKKILFLLTSARNLSFSTAIVTCVVSCVCDLQIKASKRCSIVGCAPKSAVHWNLHSDSQSPSTAPVQSRARPISC